MNKIYHVKTKVDYDALMVELEGKGYKWGSGAFPTNKNIWVDYFGETCIEVKNDKTLGFSDKDYFEGKECDIQEYRAAENLTNLTSHEKITAELFDTYKRKNHDYGDSFTDSLNEFGLVAGIVRVGDKVNRLKTLTKNEQQVSDESLRDTILDASNYLIMMAMWIDNK